MSDASHDPNGLLARSIAPEELPDPSRSLELLARAQGGDRPAFEELVARYQDRLRRIVRIQLRESPLRRDHDSMDIVQCTFRAALPKIGDLRPRSAASLLQWLALIATNQLRDAYAAQHALKRDVGREVPLDAVTAAAELAMPASRAGGAPDQEAQLSEIRELLDVAVSRLPDDQRRVVLLRDYCGEEWDRIGAELERESGAARQLHQRAWITLRRELRPKLEGRE